MDHFDPYSVLLAIATNIPVLLMTGFVLQGHKYTKLLTYVVQYVMCTNTKNIVIFPKS